MKNKPNPRVKLTITTLQARVDYMEQIAQDGILGATAEEVADYLIMRGIDDILRSGTLERRHTYRAERDDE
jgi:hypothetical protein